MFAPTKLTPKEIKKQAKLSERRAATKSIKAFNDFTRRWLALKNDAIEQCAQGDSVEQAIYAAGMYALIGLHAMQQEALVISEPDVVDRLWKMRNALGDVAELDALTYSLRCELVAGLEIIEAITDPIPIATLAKAWHFIDTGMRDQSLSTKTLDGLIRSLQAQPSLN